MIDTPESDSHDNQSNSDLKKVRTSPPAPDSATTDSAQHQPKEHRNYSQYVMMPLKAMGRGATKVVDWLDSKSGFVAAMATVLIAVLTGAYVHYSRAQWKVMRDQLPEFQRSASAAKSAAETAQQQLEMSERPWVITEYEPSAPLEFNADGSMTFSVLGKITNVGHSVALNVHDTPLITLQEVGPAMLHPTGKQKEVCDSIRAVGEKFPNFVVSEDTYLFPGGMPAYENLPLSFTRDQVEKARIGKTNSILGLVIIGCVDYMFSFSPKHHQTGYAYEIIKVAPPRHGGNLIGGSSSIRIGERVMPNQLAIRRSIFGGFYAD